MATLNSSMPNYKKMRLVLDHLRSRCTNPKDIMYHRYGGRGIGVCERWGKLYNFYHDMSPSYKPGLQLDRIDNDGDYSPENCRWVTRTQQARNKSNNRLVNYDGQIKPLAAWGEEYGISRSTLNQRFYVYKWSIQQCLTTPVRKRRQSFGN